MFSADRQPDEGRVFGQTSPRRSRSGCLWVLIGLQAVALVVVVGMALTLVGVGASFIKSTPKGKKMGVDEYPDLDEVWSYGSGHTKVVHVVLRGMITLQEEGGLFPPAAGTSHMALLAIRRATHDPKVQAIVLDIDSGGGGITASDVLYKALLDFRERRPGRKIVALFGDVGASGAYYIALAADYIVAHPTTITGSIGVLLQTLNIQELGEKIGVKDITIKSGRNKDLLNPFGELSEEQHALLQALIDAMHERFIGLVAQGRDLPLDDVRRLADGRVMLAENARRAGLIDQIGYWEDAVEKTADLLGVDEVKVYRYQQEFSLSDLLRSAGSWQPVQRWFAPGSRTRLMYLWRP